jgi:D-lactate dehydrogenase
MTQLLIFDTSEFERAHFENFARQTKTTLVLLTEALTEQWKPLAEMALASGIAVFPGSVVTAATLDKLPKLACVVTRSTGFDHIDLRACKARNISVFTVPDYGSITVAEYTIALMLALTRKLRPLIEQTAHGLLAREGLAGIDLAGLTVGIIGTGKIGREVARRLAAFSVNLIAFDVAPDQAFAQTVRLRYVPIDELFRSARLISFHLPLNTATRHLFNLKTLETLGERTYIVNTSRGAVIATDAIIQGLTSGKLAGVALDTFEGEETMMEEQLLVSEQLSQAELRRALANYHLLRSDRVILSPHNAYNTEQALNRLVMASIENLKAGLARTTNKNRLV